MNMFLQNHDQPDAVHLYGQDGGGKVQLAYQGLFLHIEIWFKIAWEKQDPYACDDFPATHSIYVHHGPRVYYLGVEQFHLPRWQGWLFTRSHHSHQTRGEQHFSQAHTAHFLSIAWREWICVINGITRSRSHGDAAALFCVLRFRMASVTPILVPVILVKCQMKHVSAWVTPHRHPLLHHT